jgi:hypothetical protein
MPSAKSGKAGSAVAPSEPQAVLEADKADPGQVEQIKAEQRQTQTGKYGSVKTKSLKPGDDDEEKKKISWIEVEMVDEDGKPVTGQIYKVTLSDGETVAEGTLDEKGLARIEGIEPGDCKVTFPRLDKDAWEKA